MRVRPISLVHADCPTRYLKKSSIAALLIHRCASDHARRQCSNRASCLLILPTLFVHEGLCQLPTVAQNKKSRAPKDKIARFRGSRYHRVKPPLAKTGYCGSFLPIPKQGYSPPWYEGFRLWLIEVSNSTLAYHLGEKVRYYGRDRIPEYWVVDFSYRTL
ncbi:MULTISPECIES: Uma2 family endonuclease [unclassified Phormidium]|uniref:Uma2 family endonuclease n=1 Tax=unclassified Phormidium TaxID=2609805 RepID=UPI0037C559BA